MRLVLILLCTIFLACQSTEEKQIATLISKGDLIEAKKILSEQLVKDPFNLRANRQLLEINTALHKAYTKRQRHYKKVCEMYLEENNGARQYTYIFPWIIEEHYEWMWYPKDKIAKLERALKAEDISAENFLKEKKRLEDELIVRTFDWDIYDFYENKYRQQSIKTKLK